MSLPRPAVCSLDLVDDVVAERAGGLNAAFFRGIAAEWREKVEHYIAHGGSPEHVGDWPAIEHKRKSFQNLYSHPAEGSAQGVMLKSLRDDHHLDLCPACGEPGCPNTLDHYLPKGRFPHFALTPVNLFPMCDACQGAKLEKTGDLQTPRYFIHPYFDTFTIPQIVNLTIAPPFNTPTFTLEPHPQLTAAESMLVTTHLRELEIAKRYIRFFRNEHRRLLKNVRGLRNSGQDVGATLAVFRAGAAIPTQNSWQHIFYTGVVENPDLLDYLINDDLPVLP